MIFKLTPDKMKYANWTKEFIWFPLFFNYQGADYFVFMSFVEVRQFGHDRQLHYRPVSDG